MLDFVAYETAQQLTADQARGALPTSPVRTVAVAARPARRPEELRRRLGAALRRLADRLEPAPAGRAAAADGC